MQVPPFKRPNPFDDESRIFLETERRRYDVPRSVSDSVLVETLLQAALIKLESTRNGGGRVHEEEVIR